MFSDGIEMECWPKMGLSSCYTLYNYLKLNNKAAITRVSTEVFCQFFPTKSTLNEVWLVFHLRQTNRIPRNNIFARKI